MQGFNSEYLQEKWAPILDYSGLDAIKDSHRRSVTAILLENQERELREERAFLSEAPTVNTGSGGYTNNVGGPGFGGQADAAGPVAGFDPVLISLIRRSMPNLVAYDLAGVQPMNGPTGLIFAMRSKYTNQGGDGIELSFPNADWSREYFGKLQSVCNAEGIPYRVSTGSDGMSFVDIDCGIDIDFALGLVNTINARVFCTPTSPRYVVSLRNAT